MALSWGKAFYPMFPNKVQKLALFHFPALDGHGADHLKVGQGYVPCTSRNGDFRVLQLRCVKFHISELKPIVDQRVHHDGLHHRLGRGTGAYLMFADDISP